MFNISVQKKNKQRNILKCKKTQAFSKNYKKKIFYFFTISKVFFVTKFVKLFFFKANFDIRLQLTLKNIY